MQGKRRDRAIWVGILPGTIAGGVVDRKELDDALSGGGCPIDERMKVLEFAYSEVVACAKREDRNRSAGASE